MTSNPSHHHRSTTKVAQKPFKSKHASKSALKEKSKGAKERLVSTMYALISLQGKLKTSAKVPARHPISRSCRSWTDATRRSRRG